MNDQPKGLGGWLILVAIGLIINPIRVLVVVLSTFPPIFTTGAWEALTTPGSENYHALWAPLIIFEMVFNTLVFLACIALAILFFRRSRRFPGLFIAFVIANLAFVLVDAWLGSLVVVDEPMFDPATTRELARSLFGLLVWVPYMRISKRVKNTFVH